MGLTFRINSNGLVWNQELVGKMIIIYRLSIKQSTILSMTFALLVNITHAFFNDHSVVFGYNCLHLKEIKVWAYYDC